MREGGKDSIKKQKLGGVRERKEMWE